MRVSCVKSASRSFSQRAPNCSPKAALSETARTWCILCSNAEGCLLQVACRRRIWMQAEVSLAHFLRQRHTVSFITRSHGRTPSHRWAIKVALFRERRARCRRRPPPTRRAASSSPTRTRSEMTGSRCLRTSTAIRTKQLQSKVAGSFGALCSESHQALKAVARFGEAARQDAGARRSAQAAGLRRRPRRCCCVSSSTRRDCSSTTTRQSKAAAMGAMETSQTERTNSCEHWGKCQIANKTHLYCVL